MKTTLVNYIKAGYSGLNIVSHEETRVEAELAAVAKETKFMLHAWSITTGIVSVCNDPVEIAESQEPFAMLGKFDGLPDKSILLLRDFHLILEDKNPMIYRKLKDSLSLAKAHNRMLVICGSRLCLPSELEKEITVIEFALPDRDELRRVMLAVCKGARVIVKPDDAELILDAASGLTTTEAENAFALSVVESKNITPSIVAREKANTIRKNGILEIVDTKIDVADIGGLQMLVNDLLEKRGCFTKAAHDY